MRTELIPVYPGRPPVIKKGTEWFYVSIRDAAFLRTMRTYRELLTQAHPDRGGNPKEFLRLTKKRASFVASERAWYKELGLGTPGGLDPVEVEVPSVRKTGPRWHEAILQQHPHRPHQSVRKFLSPEERRRRQIEGCKRYRAKLKQERCHA